ncbi:MAG: Uma2 family endonuclease [Lachnospiraceae bacterium]|nr:Uma2 family endonuclease [Lachnospiraceae bacterium]
MEAGQIRKYTVDEFFALPEGERYELIEGQLYPLYDMAEPPRIHQELVMRLSNAILNHIDANQGDCRVYPAPFGVRLSESADTVVEPDITVICDKDKLTDKGCTGAPDWILEIVSKSNPEHDYLEKCRLYLKAGVREYWIVNPMDRSVTVYFEDRPYIPRSFTFEERVQAHLFPELVIDFPGIVKRTEL